jgi:hypothetical protein
VAPSLGAGDADFLDPLAAARRDICNGKELDLKSRFALFSSTSNQVTRLIASFQVFLSKHATLILLLDSAELD